MWKDTSHQPEIPNESTDTDKKILIKQWYNLKSTTYSKTRNGKTEDLCIADALDVIYHIPIIK